ncbi:MAG: ATP-binding cassette domain-containing protein [Planctomycetota bacterium]
MSKRNHPETIVSLNSVSVDHGGAKLRRINWTLSDDELWAVVGRNGAGKSTLMRVLRDEIHLSRGEAQYAFPEGTIPAHEIVQVSFEEQVQLVDGGYAQARWHALDDTVALRGRDVLGSVRKTARGRRLIGTLGLEDLLKRRVTELSNGERRKLLLSRAAAEEPTILVLDHPFAGLDARSRRTLASAIRRLHRSGVALVLVLANEDEVIDCVTDVLFLDRGRVVASGARKRVLADARFRKAMRPAESSRRSEPKRPVKDPKTVVEFRNVELIHGRTQVLEPIDWVVRQGERWIVVGRNGAGKSALLSLVLADNPQAYSQDISIFGRRRGDGESIWETRGRLGCISPELNLFHYRDQTALSVVCAGLFDSIGLWQEPSEGQLERAEAWLKRMGLARASDLLFHELSEGERQLVLLARALIKEPELLVLDEPCQALDAHNRRRFLDVLNRVLNRTRATLIYITHDRDEVPANATHGLVLRRGRKARQGPAEKVLAAYFRGK